MSAGNTAVVVELTELRKLNGGIISKRISLGEDGRPKSDGSACRLVSGMARRKRMNGGDPAGALQDFLNGMSSKEALALGRMSDAVDDECHVVSKRQRDEYGERHHDGLPVITRTLEHFGWPREPGWALADFDSKGMPAPVRMRLAELGGFEAALRTLIIGIDEAACVVRASTSSGLWNVETDEQYLRSGGLHVYILLVEQSDVPRLLKALHQRAWLASLGWFMVGTAGQLLERSIVDVSVGSPERLVFEGAPIVVAPLQQDMTMRAAVASKATAALDSWAAVPDLTPAELNEYRRRVASERARLKPEAKAEEKRWLVREGAKLGPDGEKILKAALAKRTLSGGMTLRFDDDELGAVTIDDVMIEPTRCDGETLADPLDGVAYGTGKAKLFINEDGTVVVNSFAHGGRTFRLLHSSASARAVLERAGQGAAKLYIKILLAAEVSAAEEEQILDLVRELTGVGKRPLKSDLKKAKAEAARERAQERSERAGTVDRRVTKRAPLPDEERSPVVAHVEEVLCQESPSTVFQNVMGEVVRVTAAAQRPAAFAYQRHGGRWCAWRHVCPGTRQPPDHRPLPRQHA